MNDDDDDDDPKPFFVFVHSTSVLDFNETAEIVKYTHR